MHVAVPDPLAWFYSATLAWNHTGVDTLLRLHCDGSVAVYFEYMLHKPVFGDIARRQQLLDRLNAVPGVRLPPDAVSKRKTIPLKEFTPEATSQFLAVMDWFVDELKQNAAEVASAG